MLNGSSHDSAWSTEFSLPSGIGDVIGTLAHTSVGISALVLGTWLILVRNFEVHNKWERVCYLTAAFWEGIGPLIMLTFPSTCYYSKECFQRNISHMLASVFLAGGVVWDYTCEKCFSNKPPVNSRRVAGTRFLGMDKHLAYSLLSNIIPGLILYSHDHDANVNMQAKEDDSENVIHQNVSICMILIGLLRLGMMYYPWMRMWHGWLSIVLGGLMINAGPIIREAWVAIDLSGHNISFGIILLFTFHTLIVLAIKQANEFKNRQFQMVPIDDPEAIEIEQNY